MTLSVRYATRSDVGLIRQGNEDALYAGPRLLAVADGMGGHAAGEVASSVVISTIATLDEDTPSRDLVDVLRAAVADANDQLRQMVSADSELEGMGTTLTAMLWSGRRLALAHVGDSRAYLLRDGTLRLLTKDHTLVQSLVDEGRLAAEDVSSHPQRSMLTRALDGRDGVEPDVSVREAQPGDRYLLCTDGLSGVVSEETMATTLREPDPQVAVDALVDLALRGGGPDNITCIVADVLDASGPVAAPVMGGAAADPQTTSAPATAAASTPAARAALIEGRRTVGGTEQPAPELTNLARAMTPPPAFRWWKLVAGLVIVGLLAAGAYVGIRTYVNSQWYVGEEDGNVAVFRGVPGAVAGLHLNTLVQTSEIPVESLPELERDTVRKGLSARDQADAQQRMADLASRMSPAPTPTAEAPAQPSPRASTAAPRSRPATSPSTPAVRR